MPERRSCGGKTLKLGFGPERLGLESKPTALLMCLEVSVQGMCFSTGKISLLCVRVIVDVCFTVCTREIEHTCI